MSFGSLLECGLTEFRAGTAYSIIVAERVALNFMQRMSGIATLTKVLLFC